MSQNAEPQPELQPEQPPQTPATDPSGPVPCAVVVLAAGSGSRVGATVQGLPVNKVLLELAGRPVITHAVLTALEVPGLRHLVVVARPGEERLVAAALTPHLPPDAELRLVTGGATRHASEWAALQALSDEIASGEVEVVAVHDGARPLATPDLFARTVAAAAEHGGAIPVVPTRAVVRLDGGPAPQNLAAVQTPQAFAARALLDAYTAADAEGFGGTGTAACVEKYSPGVRVAAVPSRVGNLKVTFAEDVPLAAALLDRGRLRTG